MRTIKFNGKNLAVSASEERALFTLSRNDFAAMKSDFYERRGRHGESILPRNGDHRKQLGISEVYLPRTARERKFFTEHPRCECVITGNPRRINAILKALDAEVEKECAQELQWIRHQTLTTPSDAEVEREILDLGHDD